MAVGEVVLEDWHEVVEVGELDVRHNGISFEARGFEVGGHKQAVLLGDEGSSVVLCRPSHRQDAQLLEFEGFHITIVMVSSLNGCHARASACQKVVGVVERPQADGFGHGGIIRRNCDGACQGS